jgi:YYY domain-containing protein
VTLLDVMTASLRWYFVLTLSGLAVLPLLHSVCRSLPDRGVSLIRPVGIALLVVPLWTIGHLTPIPFNAWVILATLLLIGIPGWMFAVARFQIIGQIRRDYRRILAFEAAAFALFVAYIIFRGFAPDIANTEKPMELAFLNASMNSGQIPVEDPWFSGEAINYYYFGYVAFAATAILSGVPGEVAFNLALATVFTTATVAGAGMAANLAALINGYNRTAAIVSGAIAAFLISVAGNLHAARAFLSDPGETMRESWWAGTGWASSRIIEDGGFADGSTRTVITEFPAFSWILGDLHPHVLAYPWFIATLALIANLWIVAHRNDRILPVAVASALVGLMVGVLYSSNTWDVPLTGLLALIALGQLVLRSDWRWSAISIGSAIVGILISAGTFAASYQSPTVSASADTVPVLGTLIDSLGYVSWDRSSLAELLTHWGGLLLPLAIVIAIMTLGLEMNARRWLPFVGAVSFVLAVAALLVETPAIALFGVPVVILIWLMLSANGGRPEFEFPLILLIAGLAVLCVIEFVFVRDPFGDRMNTVFKFSFQVWAVISISVAALLPAILAKLNERAIPGLRAGVIVVLSAWILAISVYTPISSAAWTNRFNTWSGLDGLAYVERFQPDEYAAIQWLRETDEPVDVVLEAPGCSYGTDRFIPHNRVSMATGHPTVLGWDGHQHQWRRGQPDHRAEIGHRIDFTRSAFEQPGETNWTYNGSRISHLFIGAHETEGYQRCEIGPPYDLPSRERLLELGFEMVFEQGAVAIYRTPEDDRTN